MADEPTTDLLRLAADALEAQPPKLRAQYVATLRLYADEPWRLTSPHKGNHARLPDGTYLAPGFCEACDQRRRKPPGLDGTE